jgi:hypothetical protein
VLEFFLLSAGILVKFFFSSLKFWKAELSMVSLFLSFFLQLIHNHPSDRVLDDEKHCEWSKLIGDLHRGDVFLFLRQNSDVISTNVPANSDGFLLSTHVVGLHC